MSSYLFACLIYEHHLRIVTHDKLNPRLLAIVPSFDLPPAGIHNACVAALRLALVRLRVAQPAWTALRLRVGWVVRCQRGCAGARSCYRVCPLRCSPYEPSGLREVIQSSTWAGLRGRHGTRKRRCLNEDGMLHSCVRLQPAARRLVDLARACLPDAAPVRRTHPEDCLYDLSFYSREDEQPEGQDQR